MSKAAFKKLGGATAVICAATGGHKSGSRILGDEREAASARAWASFNASTRSGAASTMTPLTANPVPVEIAAAMRRFPHPLQRPLEDLIANDPALDPLQPLDEPLNPATERFDPSTVRDYEVIGGVPREIRLHTGSLAAD